MNAVVAMPRPDATDRIARNSERYIRMEPAIRHLCALTIAADRMAAVLDEYDDEELRALRDVIDMAQIEARALAGSYR